MNINTLSLLRSYMFHLGSKHSAVKTIKTFLNIHPKVPVFDLKQDILFDSKTQSALAAFQKSIQLLPTGRMDFKTWFAIGKEMHLAQIQNMSANDSMLYQLLTYKRNSNQPSKKTTLNNSFVRNGNSVSFSSNLSFPKFTILVYVNVFAPFDWFGPFDMAKGDGKNRRFGIKKGASYRMQGISEVTAADTGTEYPFSYTRVSNATTSTLGIPYFYPETKSECYINSPYNGEYQPNGLTSENSSANYHLYGNDDAFLFFDNNPVSDIDVHPSVWFNYESQADPNKVIVHATGSLIGDQFPSVEIFVLDREENGVMLGVFQVRAGDKPEFELFGDKRLPMIENIDVKIMVEKGIFIGVVKNGVVVSLAEHNSYYTNLSPVKPKYAGQLPAPDIRPK